jgi:hypothetical protein
MLTGEDLGGEGVVLNREITITNNLIYFLNLSSSILLSQSWLVQTWNFITTLFFISQFHPQTAFRQSSLCNHHSQFMKKNEEEGNSLVCYRRYCYTTAFRDVCNLIIITCTYDARISREREFPSYLISINSLSETHCPFSVD